VPRFAPTCDDDDRRKGVAEDRVELPGSRQPPIPNARVGEPVDPNLRITVSIEVRRRAVPPEINSNTPNLSREELTERYGADPADIARIEAFAREHGLQVVSESAETRTVELAGAVADMNAAFGVKLSKANIDGREFRYREGPVTLPRSIAGFVTAVLGLDDRPAAAPRAAISPATPASGQNENGVRLSGPGTTVR
jgi:kumamolisin